MQESIQKPLLSVVMITYNHAAFIREAVLGVLQQQTDFSVEVIIADDHSEDQTPRIIESVIQEHPNGKIIRYTRHQSNKGMMPNFIWALEQAKGKYIALCEGDDYWTDPLKLQKQVIFLEQNPAYNLCFHDVQILTPDGKLAPDEYIEGRYAGIEDKQNVNYKNLLSIGNFMHTCSVVYRKQGDAFPAEFAFSALGDVLLHIWNTRTGKIGKVDGRMGVYRKGVGIFSSLDSLKMNLANIKTHIVLFSVLPEFEDKKQVFSIIEKLISRDHKLRPDRMKELSKLRNSKYFLFRKFIYKYLHV